MKIRVEHYRLAAESLLEGAVYKKSGMPDIQSLNRYKRGVTPFEPHPTGGATKVTLLSDSGTVIATGITLCSMSENFSYARGFQKAYLRALMIQRLNKAQEWKPKV